MYNHIGLEPKHTSRRYASVIRNSGKWNSVKWNETRWIGAIFACFCVARVWQRQLGFLVVFRPVRFERQKVDTWKLKHAKLQTQIPESFEYFCHTTSKSILIISSYTVSMLVHFFRHSVDILSTKSDVLSYNQWNLLLMWEIWQFQTAMMTDSVWLVKHQNTLTITYHLQVINIGNNIVFTVARCCCHCQ